MYNVRIPVALSQQQENQRKGLTIRWIDLPTCRPPVFLMVTSSMLLDDTTSSSFPTLTSPCLDFVHLTRPSPVGVECWFHSRLLFNHKRRWNPQQPRNFLDLGRDPIAFSCWGKMLWAENTVDQHGWSKNDSSLQAWLLKRRGENGEFNPCNGRTVWF